MSERLSNHDLRKLKALAQRTDPILFIGKAGLSDAFFKSLDEALFIHELVKVKFAAFKEEKKTLTPRLVEKSGSHLVMRVGNVAVLYRPHPDPIRRKVLPWPAT